ncbi:MAG: 50S ribosomal protein L18 [Candidatus Limnocylindria bacterium]
MAQATRDQGRRRRHVRVRRTISGSAARPRLAIFRSLSHIYAQLIDDAGGRTLAAASSLEGPDASGGRIERARAVGAALAERARAAGIGEAVFDRGGYRYHGRVKALADAAREKGLRF